MEWKSLWETVFSAISSRSKPVFPEHLLCLKVATLTFYPKGKTWHQIKLLTELLWQQTLLSTLPCLPQTIRLCPTVCIHVFRLCEERQHNFSSCQIITITGGAHKQVWLNAWYAPSQLRNSRQSTGCRAENAKERKECSQNPRKAFYWQLKDTDGLFIMYMQNVGNTKGRSKEVKLKSKSKQEASPKCFSSFT